MICKCGAKSKVTDSRAKSARNNTHFRWRKHKCLNRDCGAVFETIEVPISIPEEEARDILADAHEQGVL